MKEMLLKMSGRCVNFFFARLPENFYSLVTLKQD